MIGEIYAWITPFYPLLNQSPRTLGSSPIPVWKKLGFAWVGLWVWWNRCQCSSV